MWCLPNHRGWPITQLRIRRSHNEGFSYRYLKQTQARTSCLAKGCRSAYAHVEGALVASNPQIMLHRLNVQFSASSCGQGKRKIESFIIGNATSDADTGQTQPPSGQPDQATAPQPKKIATGPTSSSRISETPPKVSSLNFSPLQQPAMPTTVAADLDDKFAKAWKPPPGEQPLWWVKKFEARRMAEVRRKAQDSTILSTFDRVAPRARDHDGDDPAVRFVKGILQVIQLVVVLALLLILPAALVPEGGLSLGKPYITFAAYLCFFGLGTLNRVVRYGKLAPRQQDRQVATWGGRVAFAAFVVLIPLLHWSAMYRFVVFSLYSKAVPNNMALYDAVGGVGIVVATVLNALAAQELGASYDRIAVPASLVTTGPYQYMQHPIYTSYMLLFFSYGIWLHSAPTALLMLLVCSMYYRARAALEACVLEGAFGNYYRDYASRTKRYIPFVV